MGHNCTLGAPHLHTHLSLAAQSCASSSLLFSGDAYHRQGEGLPLSLLGSLLTPHSFWVTQFLCCKDRGPLLLCK